MTILESQIDNFISTVNCGDEMILSQHGSIEQRTGLILGYGHTGWYLLDSGHRVELGATVTSQAIMLIAADWASDTGVELA